MKDSFLLYTEHSELVGQLSNAQAGELFKGLFSYTSTGTVPELDPMCKIVFTAIRQDLDRNAQKYEQKCEKMRQNGLKGGRGRGRGKCIDKCEITGGEQTEPLQQDVQNETNEEISSNREDLNLAQNDLPQDNLPQKAIAFSENQTVFSESKKSHYDNDNVNDNDNDNVLSLNHGEKISKDEREIIENYVRKNKLATKSVSAYSAKLISNGDYKQILEKEKKKSRPQKSRGERIKAELSTIHDKRSAAKILAEYYSRGDPPAEFDEIMQKYDLDTYDKAEKYMRELYLATQKSRAP